MLIFQVGDTVRLVTQPDHAALSGFFAAHWGNAEFAAPADYGRPQEAAVVGSETIFAIAEHDNGWWEWEADPEIDEADGLPLHFLAGEASAGLDRWRRGVGRFSETHPWAALLISHHAFWLHEVQANPECDDDFRHPIFGVDPPTKAPDSREGRDLREFLDERRADHWRLIERLRATTDWGSAAVEPERLQPSVRLLQVLDSMSIVICAGLADTVRLQSVPRRGWEDRVTMELQPLDEQTIRFDPYPFDKNPLKIGILAQIVDVAAVAGPYRSWRRRIPRTMLHYKAVAG